MAEIKPLLRREPDVDFLSEDDPLAELARIVGFEPKAEPRPAAAAQRREPEFDLEDELLKEFDQYSAPDPVSVSAAEEIARVEQAFVSEEPLPEASDWSKSAPVESSDIELASIEPMPSEPVVVEPVATESDEAQAWASIESVPAEPHLDDLLLDELETPWEVQTRAAEVAPSVAPPVAVDDQILQVAAPSPVADLEDMIMREFSAFDARRTPVESPVVEPLRAEIARQEPAFEDAWQDEPLPEIEAEAPSVHDYVADDLSDLAVDDAFAPIAGEPEVEAPAIEENGYWADLDAEALSRAAELEPASDVADIVDDVAADSDLPEDFAPQFDDVVPAAQPEIAEDYLPTEPVASEPEPLDPHPVEPVPAVAAAPAVYNDYGLDELLADVERFPVAEMSGRWGVQAHPADESDLPLPPAPVAVLPVYDGIESASNKDTASGDDELVGDYALQGAASEEDRREPDLSAALLDELVGYSDSEPVAAETQPAWAPEPLELAAEPAQDTTPLVAVKVEPATVARDFDDSEFANFEFDLDDIDIDLGDLADPVEASPALMADLADADVGAQAVAAAVPTPAPTYAMPPKTSAALSADYATLPFDPTQITSEEDVLEALGEMDVPEPPAVTEEHTELGASDYDIDLDAEMADLFAGPVETAPVRDLAAAPAPMSSYNAMELDEFERALEEDFRQSLKANQLAGDPDRVAIAPMVEPPVRKSGNRWMLWATAAVVIVAAGGAGVYAFVTGDSSVLTPSTEPKIILADKDPVRVVPDDKGGRTVPNQDKAVYDRVSGTQTDVAKQESLVTSSEQPVDVVQKTLMPENMPMDDDSLSGTPTEDTTDPRLLPKEEQDRISTANKVVSGVSPRKVKTMVVRADGTLVPRDDTAQDAQQQATNDAELMKIAQKAAADAEKAAAPVDDVARAIETVPDRLEPTDTTDTSAAPSDSTAVTESAEKSVTLPAASDAVTEAAPANEAASDVVAEKPTVPATDTEAATNNETVAEKPVDVVAADPVPVETPVTTPVAETPVAETPVAETPVAETLVETKVEPEPSTVDNTPAVEPTDTAATTTTDVATEDATTIAAAADAVVEETAPVRKVKTSTFTPIPENRPIEQPVNVVGRVTERGTVNEAEPTQVAAADPVTQPVATAPAGSYVIQIASLPSQAEAEASYQKLSSKFGSVIGGRSVDIRKAQIKNKGTYYRVRVVAGTKAEAQALCAQYKSAGGSCLVSK